MDFKLLSFKGRSKGNLNNLGVAYITLQNEVSLAAALTHNEEEFMGRNVKITKAEPLKERVPKKSVDKIESAKKETSK